MHSRNAARHWIWHLEYDIIEYDIIANLIFNLLLRLIFDHYKSAPVGHKPMQLLYTLPDKPKLLESTILFFER